MSNRNSKFTLVRKPTVQGAKLALAKGRKRAVPGPKKIPSNRSNPVIRKAFSKSGLDMLLQGPKMKPSMRTAESVKRQPPVARAAVKVGIIDLGAWLGTLPRLLNALNRAQQRFMFFEVQSAVPAGIISEPSRVVEWAKTKGIRQGQLRTISRNIIADEFFPVASRMRKDLALDVLVGVTPAMIAGTDGAEVFWNHFSVGKNSIALLSTQDLRRYAAAAGRPYEVAVGVLLIPQLLQLHSSKLGFHKDTGCLFDYNGTRDTLVQTIASPRIEPSCLAKMPSSLRAPAEALAKTLARYR